MMILWRTFRDKKYTLLAYCLGELAMVWLYVALYPTINQLSGSYNEILQTFPDSLLEAFGFEGDFGGFTSYLAAEHYGIIWPIIALLFLASLAGAALTKEIEVGTIEIILSQPVSRLRIFAAKYLAGVVQLLVFLLCSILATIPFAALYNIEYSAKPFWIMTILGLLFGLASFSLGMMFATMFSDRGKVYLCLGGIFVGMYVLKIIAVLNEQLSGLKYLSFFYYFNVSDALQNESISTETYLVFLGVALAATTTAAIWFNKRDIAV